MAPSNTLPPSHIIVYSCFSLFLLCLMQKHLWEVTPVSQERFIGKPSQSILEWLSECAISLFWWKKNDWPTFFPLSPFPHANQYFGVVKFLQLYQVKNNSLMSCGSKKRTHAIHHLLQYTQDSHTKKATIHRISQFYFFFISVDLAYIKNIFLSVQKQSQCLKC